MAHDRTLLGAPEVSSPSPFARRVVAKFEVSGNSFQDRLTRCFAGPRVTMDVTVWPVKVGTNLGYRFYAHNLSRFYNCDWIIGRTPHGDHRPPVEIRKVESTCA
jgi:hypothetical protein